MEEAIKRCTAAMLAEWRLALASPTAEAAELHYQASTLYKAQLGRLRSHQSQNRKDDSADEAPRL